MCNSSIKCRQQFLEWTVVSHVICFIHGWDLGEVIGFQVLLDSRHPHSTRASWWSPSVLQGEGVKILSSNYTFPWTRTRFGDRAFSVAGPVVWNSLPAAVREADSLHSFRRKLKRHLFILCFNDCLIVFTNFCNAFPVQGLTTSTYLLTYLLFCVCFIWHLGNMAIQEETPLQLIKLISNNNNYYYITNKSQICIAPYGHNFRDESDKHCRNARMVRSKW